jgi:tRNA-dihydrouridine synthase B
MKMQWKIGQVEMQNPFILAPMAGVTDLPFRLLCKEQGAGLLCTEMVSAKAISFHNKNTISLMQIDPAEHPVSMQIFGSEPDLMAEVAKSIEEQPFDILDINMGCPVPKVVNNGEGSALMKDPVLVGRIVEKMADALDKPLTIKIRAGFDENSINAPEIAHIAQESGAAAVAVHGRTRQQYYQGHADWSVIARVKEACIIPIIGNGDINTPQDIIDMRAQTNCDGFMIGRGARGNPWIFRDMKYYYEHGELPDKPDIYEVKDMMLRHARLMVEFKGEYTGIHEMRKHVAWYSVGMYDSAKLRSNVNQVETYEELEELLCRWADSAPEKVIVS